jgi:hypothetical protein
MKLTAFDHPKTLALKSALKCSLPCVIGYLELLWKFTSQHSPQGDIGKWPDSSIAEACFWEGDPSIFVNALTDLHYLDKSSKHRLLVHDWQEHCPQWVRAKLSKKSLPFFTIDEVVEPTKEGTKEPSSSLAKPSVAKPRKMRAPVGALFSKFWEAYPRKKSPGAAEKAWAKLKPDAELLATMLEAIKAQTAERAAKTQRGEFVPEWKHPATWLNARAWEDVVDIPAGIRQPKTAKQIAEEKHREAMREALADVARYQLRKQLPGEPDENFLVRVKREVTDRIVKGAAA